MEPINRYSVSPSPCHLTAFVMSREVLVCSASWGEGPDYNLVPSQKGHFLLN